MKSKIALIGIGCTCLLASAGVWADSWLDFTASLNNGSFLQGRGVSTNSGFVLASGGASDQNGSSAFSSLGYLNGVTTGHRHHSRGNEGSVNENIGTSVSVSQTPSSVFVSTGSTASVFSSSLGHGFSAGSAGMNTSIVSVTGQQTP